MFRNHYFGGVYMKSYSSLTFRKVPPFVLTTASVFLTHCVYVQHTDAVFFFLNFINIFIK